MARLVVVIHEHDKFAWRESAPGSRIISPYLLCGVLRGLKEFGHSWVVGRGPHPVRGDVALLHVDATVVDEEYLSLRSAYAGTVNFEVADISKRRISTQLVTAEDDWAGPVIVKANLNCGGQTELMHNLAAQARGQPAAHRGVGRWTGKYRIVDRLQEVTEEVWKNPALVVERFLPEPDPAGGFAYRTWVFAGARERCNRFVTAEPISKGAGVLRYEPVGVPAKIREERARLNFDFGSFDFVIHEGEPILLDANRTPGVANSLAEMINAGHANLAEGLDRLVRERC